MSFDLSSIRKVHFIGIGGIGISAVARLFLAQGKKISGSDRTANSPVIKELKKLGAKIYRGHQAKQVSAEVGLVVYTTAIGPDNPEWIESKRRGVPMFSYPEMLGQLTADKYTIAVAGTHGKTTTTAMLADVLTAGKLDPTVIVGSLLKPKNKKVSPTNLIIGRSKYFIAEACEYKRAFLNLTPKILVITNIDNDHLDYYRDLADIQSAFAELTSSIISTGTLICDTHDPRLAPIIKVARCRVLDYREFDQQASNLKLQVIGAHNHLNAAVALAVAKVLKINSSVSARALNKFRGTWRRLEYLGRTRRGARIYDDYGHHPTEIRATLAAIRCDLKLQGRLIVVFQPHLYSRTKLLFKEFVESFVDADEILILPIYAAREPVDKTISSRILAAAIPRAVYVPNMSVAAKRLSQSAGLKDLILTLGAGPVFVLGEKLRYNR